MMSLLMGKVQDRVQPSCTQPVNGLGCATTEGRCNTATIITHLLFLSSPPSLILHLVIGKTHKSQWIGGPWVVLIQNHLAFDLSLPPLFLPVLRSFAFLISEIKKFVRAYAPRIWLRSMSLFAWKYSRMSRWHISRRNRWNVSLLPNAPNISNMSPSETTEPLGMLDL